MIQTSLSASPPSGATATAWGATAGLWPNPNSCIEQHGAKRSLHCTRRCTNTNANTSTTNAHEHREDTDTEHVFSFHRGAHRQDAQAQLPMPHTSLEQQGARTTTNARQAAYTKHNRQTTLRLGQVRRHNPIYNKPPQPKAPIVPRAATPPPHEAQIMRNDGFPILGCRRHRRRARGARPGTSRTREECAV